MATHHRGGTRKRRHVRLVRTTLTIDDDVLEAAQCIADDEHVSVGDVLSRLARRGLYPRPDEPAWDRFPAPMLFRPPAPGGGAFRGLDEQ